MLRIEQVCKTFASDNPEKSVVALTDVSLTVTAGEFVSIIGPSGCGKSTLMDIAAGLESTSSGHVFIGDDEITKPHPSVGVVFQQDATFPWLTNRENVEFGLKRLKLDKKEAKARAMDSLALVGVESFADHYPAQLSGGMRQRVNIARVLAARPGILLMDEPFGALDEQTRLLLSDELLNIWRETGSTVMFITHGLSEAALLSDRIVVMSPRPGQIKECVTSPLGKDRTTAVISSPGFADLTGHLWEQLSSLQTIDHRS